MESLEIFGIRAGFGDGGIGHKRACGVNGLGGLDWLAARRFSRLLRLVRHCEERSDEAIHTSACLLRDGLLRRFRLRPAGYGGALLAMTKTQTSSSPRRQFVRALQIRHPRKARVQGMPGARTHPLPCVQKEKTHAGQHRYAEITPTFPAQWLERLLRALPGVSGLIATVA